jgi:hypothetical protein
MNDFPTDKPLDADARRLAIEAIATLAHVKRIAADQLLRPSGVPEELIRNFVKGRDATTGAPPTKRQGGAIILDQIARDGSDRAIVRSSLILLQSGRPLMVKMRTKPMEAPRLSSRTL